ncbi:MAG: phospholipase D-like domain-containing protein [Acidobacteriota bacterium]
MPQVIEEWLVQSLEDHRLSRGERRALREVLRETDASQEELAFLRNRAFELARRELATATATGPQRVAVLSWLESVVKSLESHRRGALPPVRQAEAFFSPGLDCRAQILSLLSAAREKVDVCVFTITDDRISERLLQTCRRGVRVRLITDGHKSWDLGSDTERLEASGIEVAWERGEGHMHHKFALFDAETLLTGSYNWTRSAATENQENLVVTDDRRLVEPFQQQFETLWRELRRPGFQESAARASRG